MRTYYIQVNGEEISAVIPELDALYQSIISGLLIHQDISQYTAEFDNEIILRYGPTARFVGSTT